LNSLSLNQLHEQYVRGTVEKSIVINITITLCNLSVAVQKGITCNDPKVYLTSRALKHIYDKRPAEEYDALMNFILQAIEFPDRIYQNKNGKRGAYCFVKRILNEDYLVSLESSLIEPQGIYLGLLSELGMINT